MSDDAFSISDVESEGEGPNIRPPQASGSHGGKKSHKHKIAYLTALKEDMIKSPKYFRDVKMTPDQLQNIIVLIKNRLEVLVFFSRCEFGCA